MQDPRFDCDVFISYAHIDNKIVSKGQEGQEGWIDMLDRALNVRLAQLLGEEPIIWRDPKLRGNDIFDQEIVSKLVKATILISVLSPRYVKSDWCLKEINEFIQAAEQSDGMNVGNKSRILKVVKTHIPLETHPAKIRKLLGYEFFRFDSQDESYPEFVKGFGREIEPEYWAKLEDLASDICKLLKKIKTGSNGSFLIAPSSGLSVYLAETTSDLSDERDQIRRDLQARGHTVLPDQQLPLSGPELESFVQDNLQRCNLSIHLMGKPYGIVPEDADQSVIALQNALATTQSQHNADFSRLIWLPPGLQTTDERQRAFLTDLQNDPALQAGDDLLQTDLEELKTAIQDKLQPKKSEQKSEQKPEQKPELDPASDSTPDLGLSGPTRIYLICDQRDQDAIQALDDYLYDQEFEVLRPLFEGDEAEVSEEHQANLRDCDAILFYYGQANEAWLRAKLRDLRKAPGYGRTTPILATTVYVAGPSTPQKERYRTREVDTVIKNFEDFAPDSLAPFLSIVAQKTGEQD